MKPSREPILCAVCGKRLLRSGVLEGHCPQCLLDQGLTDAMRDTASLLRSGTRLGKYEIRKLLGRGGMGEVYLAWDTQLERNVALKLLRDEYAQSPEFLERFHSEARAAAALQHPNVCVIYEVGASDGQTFIAMEYVDGPTLTQYLAQMPRPRPGSELVEIALEIAGGLEAAHAKGIIHRDIKCSNILMSGGRPKITDFGLAKRTSEGHSATELSSPGTVLGTAAYMSPEQALGRKLDHRSDLFSFGAVLYEMVAGHPPFRRATVEELLVAIAKDEPEPIPREVGPVSRGLHRVLRTALAKDPRARYQATAEMKSDLLRVREELRAERSRVRSALMSRGGLFAAVAALLLVLVAGGSTGVRWLRNGPVRAEVRSLAVLPLDAGAQNLDADILGEGVAEQSIRSLSRLPNLKVMAYSAVLPLKGENPLTAGRRLGVDAVLAGRIVRRDGRLEVRVELIDTRDGTQMWGEHYDRRFEDILDVEDDIARQVSERMRLELTREQRQLLARPFSPKPQAYQEYVTGRYFWSKRGAANLHSSIEHFEKAVAEEPGWALAHAGLASSYVLLPTYSAAPARENFERARSAAQKALELDSNLVEGYIAMAQVRYQKDLDWAGAERDFRKAIQLNSGHAPAHHQFVDVLYYQGRYDEALTEIRRALELDPVSPVMHLTMGQVYYSMRRHEEAIGKFEDALKLDPGFSMARSFIGLAHLQTAKYQEAIADFEHAIRINPASPVYNLARAYARAGRRSEAERILADLLAQTGRRYVSAQSIAVIYMDLGDHGRALEWLTRAVDNRESLAHMLKAYPDFDPLRPYPRFRELLRRMKLEP